MRQRIDEDLKAPTIVYVTMQKTAEHVANFLRDNGINSFPYHAGMANEERERVIAALEYFSEQGWIELQSKQAIEAYDILKSDFNAGEVGKKMVGLFEAKEKQEIQRIHNLVDFFSSGSCISNRLAHYFSEDIKKERCGHYSFCRTGPAVIQHTSELTSLSTFSVSELTGEFSEVAGDYCSVQLSPSSCAASLLLP